MIIQFVTQDRPIIEVEINNKKGYMLVDTGASMSLIDSNKKKYYGFKEGTVLKGTLSGIGGENQSKLYHTKDLNINIFGIPLYQFVSGDISAVADSIETATGIRIVGIIGTPQIKSAEMKIKLDENHIKLGY